MTTHTMPAIPIRHTYSSGKPFYIVTCAACSIALNSGHHYPEVDGQPSPHAIAIAEAHNQRTHTP